MIKDHLAVMKELKNYASPEMQLSGMIKFGSIIRIRISLFADYKNISTLVPAPIGVFCHGTFYFLILFFISRSSGNFKNYLFLHF